MYFRMVSIQDCFSKQEWDMHICIYPHTILYHILVIIKLKRVNFLFDNVITLTCAQNSKHKTWWFNYFYQSAHVVGLSMETENQVYKTPWESIIKDVKKDVEKSTVSKSSKSSNPDVSFKSVFVTNLTYQMFSQIFFIVVNLHIVNVKTTRKILSNYVCFSKSPNFKSKHTKIQFQLLQISGSIQMLLQKGFHLIIQYTCQKC